MINPNKYPQLIALVGELHKQQEYEINFKYLKSQRILMYFVTKESFCCVKLLLG